MDFRVIYRKKYESYCYKIRYQKMLLDEMYPAHVQSSSYDTYIARYLTKIPDPPIYLDRGVSSTVGHFGTGKQRFTHPKNPFSQTFNRGYVTPKLKVV